MFPTEVALSEYSLQNGKIFPRELVGDGTLLSALLRRILHPGKGSVKKKGN